MMISTVAHHCWPGWCWAVRMSWLVVRLDSQAPEAHSQATQEVHCLNLSDSGHLLWERCLQDPHYWLGRVAVLQSCLLPPPAPSQNPDYVPGIPVCLWSLLMENRTGRKTSVDEQWAFTTMWNSVVLKYPPNLSFILSASVPPCSSVRSPSSSFVPESSPSILLSWKGTSQIHVCFNQIISLLYYGSL